MTEPVQTLLREALVLSQQERAELIAQLLISLEGTDDEDAATVEQAWTHALERRARRTLAGRTSGGEDWRQVRGRGSEAR